MSEEVLVEPNQFLIREGEESTQMYYVKEGTLAVFKKKGNAEHQIGTIYAGELVGEMSFLDKEPRSASVKTISECSLVAVPSEKFEKVFKELPPWYQALINTLLDRLRKANARVRI